MGEGKRLFELGGQWIERRGDSPSLYRFWYDARAGELRRRSLKTANLEEAKLKLAAIVGQGLRNDAQEPEKVLLSAVLTHYYESHSDALPSSTSARRAGDLVIEFLADEAGLGDTVKVAAFTKGMQAAFAKWCAEEHGYKVSYIARILTVINAAFRHAAQEVVRKVDGELTEVKLLRYAPSVHYGTAWLSKVTELPEPTARDYVPSYEDLASLLDFPASDTVRRFDIMILNTWSRPAAVIELDVGKQVKFEHQLVDLNPPGRRQTKKRRPLIRLTSNLEAWLKLWGDDRPLKRTVLLKQGKRGHGKPVKDLKAQFVKRTFRWMLTRAGFTMERIRYLEGEKDKGRPDGLREAIRMAEAAGIKRITPYTLRHFMATRVRGLEEITVEPEQREIWMGHRKGSTTEWYEHFDPEYLRACAEATDLVIAKLDALTTRPLIPDSLKARMAAAGLKVVKE